MITEVVHGPSVRSGVRADLEAIGQLFTPAKPSALLQWLVSEDGGGLRSLVATQDNRIVGHVAYTRSTFTDGERTLTGVYPILWKVREDLKGALGLRLLTRVLSFGDFSYIIGGSAAAQKLYRVFGYRALFDIPGFRKTLNLRGLGAGLFTRRGAQAVRMRSRAVLSMLGSRPATRAAFVPGEWTARPAVSPVPGTMLNAVTPSLLQWAAACPVVESHGGMLHLDDRPVGPVLCYVRRGRSEPVTGTIVHAPYLGADPDAWSAAVYAIERHLASLGCSRITMLASDDSLALALTANGFVVDRLLPFWYRGKGEPASRWYLSYLEGDLGFRK